MGRYDQVNDKKSTGVVLGIVVIALAVAGWLYFNPPSRRLVETETKALKLPFESGNIHSDEAVSDGLNTDQNIVDGIDLAELVLPEQLTALPELASSDQSFRVAMLGVSSKLAPWMKAPQLIRKYTVIANDFAQGLWLEKHMRFLKQNQPFSVDDTDNGLYMSEEGYRRYDKLAEAIDAMDVGSTLVVYRQFKPLLLQVYVDFGYPAERPLEDIFLKSAAQILGAPVIEQPIALVRPSVFYKYADAKLEALSPVSKQMLRMGPRNTRIIQNKIRQLVQELVNTKD